MRPAIWPRVKKVGAPVAWAITAEARIGGLRAARITGIGSGMRNETAGRRAAPKYVDRRMIPPRTKAACDDLARDDT